MGMRIQTNLQALNAQRNLGVTTKANDESLEKLSSGFRINKASDDAAGLAISEKLKADIRGLNIARRNANDGISLIQTAEGGMNEIGNILIRLRELAVQGSSDTLGNTERGFIHKEFNALKSEVDRITNSTEFNGNMLLSGKSELPPELSSGSNPSPYDIQVGIKWHANVDGKDAQGEFASNPVNIIRLNMDKINTSTSKEGLNLGHASEETLDSTGVFLESDTGQSKLRAQMSIEKIDNAIKTMSGYRSELGANQSRLGSTISNLSIQGENYSAANSRIRDTDFAEETAKSTQTNILKQAGVSVLSQANQSPNAALALLR